MNILRLEQQLVVVSRDVGVASYDFDFSLHFACDHPCRFDEETPCVLRVGPVGDYAADYADLIDIGLRPVNSPAQHALASELEHWYPRLQDLTPRTRVFESLPTVERIEEEFQWPVFLKGSRQTSKHDPELAVIRHREHYRQVAERYRRDPILHWQKPAIREFLALQPVAGEVAGKVRPSLEFRSFWWRGRCVGWGRYWHQVPAYDCEDAEAGLAVAAEAAARLDVPFLVVDFARTTDGRWVVIECNDAQESGYVGIAPQCLWREVLASADETLRSVAEAC